jgi:uncharacterized protein YbaP (TraB family)
MHRVVVTAFCCVFFLFSRAQQKTYPQTLLWRIAGNNLSQPSYLYGTMHVTDKRVFYFGDSLYSCLEKAQGFAMEINPDSAIGALFRSLLSPDTTGLLKDAVNAKEFSKVAKRLETELGVPANRITKKQAWLYSYKGGKERKEDDMDSPVDTYLYNIAKRQGKWVGGIEDIEDQLNLVEELGPKFNVDALVYRDNSKAALEKIKSIYINQDLTRINEWIGFSGGKNKSFRDDVLDRRNTKMAHRIDSMAHVRSNFFAVGAAHLPGTNGLITLLEQRGFTVEPIMSSKKIAPEKYHFTEVELPWQTVEDDASTYTVQMPGKPFPMKLEEGQVTMNCYADIGTGLIYFVTSVTSPIKLGNMDSVLASVSRNMSNNGTIQKQQAFEYKGMRGLEVFAARSDDYYYRIRIFMHGEIIYMVMTGSEKKSLLEHQESNRFLNSLVVKAQPVKPAGKPGEWIVFDKKNRGMMAMFPGQPERNKQMEQAFNKNASTSKWNFECYTYSDIASDIFYMLYVKETIPGYVPGSDSAVFVEMKENAVQNYAKSVPLYETFPYKGYPAMRMHVEYKSNNLFMRSMVVNRANRIYYLMALTEKDKGDTVSVNRFLSSLELTEPQQQDWALRPSPDNTFSAWTPAAISKLYYTADNGDTTRSVIISYDSLSSLSFMMEKSPLRPYYWTESDSSFFAERLLSYKEYTDSVLSVKPVLNGSVKGMEYVIAARGNHNLRKVRILPFGDTTYALSLYAPPDIIKGTNQEKFFTAFRFANENVVNNYTVNKAKQVIDGLHVSDPVTFADAVNAIYNAPFTKKDLPLLHRALLGSYREDEEGTNINRELGNRIATIGDSSTIAFIAENYRNLNGEKEKLKYELLSVLTRMQTQSSYNLLRDLLLQHPPIAGDPELLKYRLTDSIQLAASIVPSLLPLSKDTIFIKILPWIINKLVDDTLMPAGAVSAYRKEYYHFALRELKRLKTVEYDYQSVALIELLGRFRDAEANNLLQQFLRSKHLDVKQAAAIALARNNQPVDPFQAEKIAANINYRCDFYSELEKYHKGNLFPAKYRNQKSLAEAEVYVMAADESDTAVVHFIGERTAKFKGKQQRFYLYKAIINSGEDESVHLAIAGPYGVSASKSKLIASSDAASIYWREGYDKKKVDEQFKELLAQMEDE